MDFLLKEREGLTSKAKTMQALARTAKHEYTAGSASKSGSTGAASSRTASLYVQRTPGVLYASSASSESKQATDELSSLGVQLDASVVERMQSRLGSDLFASAIKAAQTLRGSGGSSTVSSVDNRHATVDSRSPRSVHSGSHSQGQGQGQSFAGRWTPKTPMGHLLDVSMTSSLSGDQDFRHGGHSSDEQEQEDDEEYLAVPDGSGADGKSRAQLLDEVLEALGQSRDADQLGQQEQQEQQEQQKQQKQQEQQEQQEQQQEAKEEAKEESSGPTGTEAGSPPQQQEAQSLPAAAVHVFNLSIENGKMHAGRSANNRENEPVGSPGKASQASQGRGPGGPGGGARSGRAPRSTHAGPGTNTTVDSIAGITTGTKVMSANTSITSPINHRLFDVSAEPDAVSLAMLGESVPQTALPLFEPGKRWSGGPIDRSAHEELEAEAKEETPKLISYLLQRGIAKLDVNDNVEPAADLAMPLWAGGDASFQSERTSEYSPYSRGVPSPPSARSPSHAHAHSKAWSSGAQPSMACDADRTVDEHLAVSMTPGRKELVLAAVGRLSPQKVQQQASVQAARHIHAHATYDHGYEHEGLPQQPRTQRELALLTARAADEADTSRIALAASAIDSIDPCYRQELDNMVQDLQYDYASNSEKFVRRLYDYPINAPKVNIKMVMHRRYAHSDFFRNGVTRCLIGGRGGTSKWGDANADRTQEVVFCLYQLVHETKRLPGELERRPCVDLHRFLRMLRTTDILRSQWRIGGKKAIEELNVQNSLHRKENGGTNAPIPTENKKKHMLQRLVDEGSQSLQIGDSVTRQYENRHVIFSEATRYKSGLPHGRQPNEMIQGAASAVSVVPETDAAAFRADNREFPKESDKNAKIDSANVLFQSTKPIQTNTEYSSDLRALLQPEVPSEQRTSVTDAGTGRRSSHGVLHLTHKTFRKAHLSEQSNHTSHHIETHIRSRSQARLTRSPCFLEHQSNSSSVAAALHGREDESGREKFADLTKPVDPYKNISKQGYMAKKLDETNRSEEEAKYHAFVDKSLFRQVPRGQNKPAEYQSVSAAIKYNDCGVAALL